MPEGPRSVPPRTRVEETQGDVQLWCPWLMSRPPGRHPGRENGGPSLTTPPTSSPRWSPNYSLGCFPPSSGGWTAGTQDCPSGPCCLDCHVSGAPGGIPGFQKARGTENWRKVFQPFHGGACVGLDVNPGQPVLQFGGSGWEAERSHGRSPLVPLWPIQGQGGHRQRP